jgi:nucleoside-diphosphate-sugar epimerase
MRIAYTNALSLELNECLRLVGKVFTEFYGLETISLRYLNVFGPRQDPYSQYAAVIPRFIKNALQQKVLEIHGDGLQSRDLTYIDNVVGANLLGAVPARRRRVIQRRTSKMPRPPGFRGATSGNHW